MNFISLVKVVLSPFPGGAVANQILAEIESVEVDRRLKLLEDPLAGFGPDAKALCGLLYESVRKETHVTSKVPWSDAFEPYLKTLRSFDASGLVGNEPVLFNSNPSHRGIRIEPRFMVYLAMIGGDEDLCRDMADFMDNLLTGVTCTQVRERIRLPIPVIDAVFSVYDSQNQGLKSKENGYCYYAPY